MSRQRLIHDAAWATALAILDSVRSFLREEEYGDAHKTFYDIIKTGIEGLDLMQAREDHHLLRKVSKN